MSSLVVKPVGALEGEVRAYGAKNAVHKQMAACLLATGEHLLTNVPNITDVGVMAELLEALGCRVTRPSEHEVVVDVPVADALHPVAPAHLFEAMRASIVILGPLLARCGRADMALPGGDDFGQRPINFHTDGLTAMGATFHNDRNSIRASCDRPRMRATRITLEYPSHTATDNLLMACVLAEGRSVIDNAAREPEVEDLGRQLQAMGAHIEGLGTSRLTIDGVEELHPAVHHVVTDRVVSATYLASGLITGGAVRVGWTWTRGGPMRALRGIRQVVARFNSTVDRGPRRAGDARARCAGCSARRRTSAARVWRALRFHPCPDPCFPPKLGEAPWCVRLQHQPCRQPKTRRGWPRESRPWPSSVAPSTGMPGPVFPPQAS